MNKAWFEAASVVIVEAERPVSVRVSPNESVIVVIDAPPVECMSTDAKSADWLIPAFRYENEDIESWSVSASDPDACP